MPFDAYRKYIAPWYKRDIAHTDDEVNFRYETSPCEDTPFLRAAEHSFEHIRLVERYRELQDDLGRTPKPLLKIVPDVKEHPFNSLADPSLASPPQHEVVQNKFRQVLACLNELGPKALEDSLDAQLMGPREETKNLLYLHLHQATCYADPLLPAFNHFDQQFLYTDPEPLDLLVARNRHLQIIEYMLISQREDAPLAQEWAKNMHIAYSRRFDSLPGLPDVHLARFSVAHVLGDRERAAQALKALSSSHLFPTLVRIFNEKRSP